MNIFVNNVSDSYSELSYEFLMQCAKGPFAKRPPADWDRIQKECPNIVRKVVVDENANDVLPCTNDYTNATRSNNRKSLIDNEFASPFQNNFDGSKQAHNSMNNNNNNTELKYFFELDYGSTQSCYYSNARPKINMNAFKRIIQF